MSQLHVFRLTARTVASTMTDVPSFAGPRDTAETLAIKNRILDKLEQRRAGKPYRQFAQDVGVSHPTLFSLVAGSPQEQRVFRPGLDTLAVLVAWSPDEFESLVLDYIKAHGKNLRKQIIKTP